MELKPLQAPTPPTAPTTQTPPPHTHTQKQQILISIASIFFNIQIIINGFENYMYFKMSRIIIRLY